MLKEAKKLPISTEDAKYKLLVFLTEQEKVFQFKLGMRRLKRLTIAFCPPFSNLFCATLTCGGFAQQSPLRRTVISYWKVSLTENW